MLPEEVSKFIGQSEEVMTFEVEKGAIKKFADAVGDQNPLYWDEEYARNSRYGSIIAPPGFFGWPTKWTMESTFPLYSETSLQLIAALTKAGYSQILDRGIEYDFFSPVRVGDTLAVSTLIKDITEREDKEGRMVLVVIETSYTNQDGELVAKVRQILVHH